MFVLTIIVTIRFPVLRTELYKKFRIIFLIIKAVYISSPWRSIGIKSIWYFFLLAENVFNFTTEFRINVYSRLTQRSVRTTITYGYSSSRSDQLLKI